MPTWPSTLPEPLLEPYAITPNDNAIRTDFEQGNSRARRRATANRERIAVEFLFETAAQMATFRTFWRTTLSDGVAWFDLPIDLGSGTVTLSVHFTQPYSAKPLGAGLWRVAAEIETEAL